MNKEKKLYLRELRNPLEIFSCKKIIKMMLIRKKGKFKKFIRNVLELIILLNYEISCYKGRVYVKKSEDYIIGVIPIHKNGKSDISKIIRNINKVIKEEKINNIIVSEELKKIDGIKNAFVSKSLQDGKYLLKIMIDKAIEYISNTKNERIENQTIYILVNEYSKINLEIIQLLTYKAKSVNIVTNQLRRFLIFEKKIYENSGIMITVSNNKRKGIKRASWIINFDFSQEELLQYNINRDAFFINLQEDEIKISKSFSGVFINGLLIKESVNKQLEMISGYKLFNQTILYESTIDKNKSFEEIRKKIENDNVEIESLIGSRGKLEASEYIKMA